ncbi:MAG: PH domain-containing protein [Erythrobacter sp.]|nr:MAG: PH domain-containing protein [Erythrobacter sp.]
MDEVRDSFRSSLGRWLVGTSAGLGTLLLGLAGFAVMVGSAGNYGPYPLLLTALAVLIVGWKWLQVMSESFQITAQRVIVRRGIIMKSVDEIELYRIKDVRLDFSLLNQMAGIGNLTISSSDETTRNGKLSMAHIAKAQARREEIRRLVDAARRERGVREIDMVHEDF